MNTPSTTRRPALFERLLMRVADKSVVDRYEIAVNTFEETGTAILARVRDALGLIKTHDPRRYERLQRQIPRIWVRILSGSWGSFNSAMWACQLDSRFVLGERVTPEEIAATIVHEGTHARIYACGIPYSEQLRPRIETICLRQEIVFADRLPRGAVVRAQAERGLARALDLSNAAIARRNEEGTIDALQYLVPKWALLVLLRLRAAIGALTRLASRLTRA